MKAVWFAIGNPLRGDDGAAHRVVEILDLADRVHSVHQLTPELAAELAGKSEAVFLDADAAATEVTLEPMPPDAPFAAAQISHHTDPAAIVALARRLYGFTGEAWLCRIPARDFRLRDGLSPQGEMHSRIASHILKQKGEQWFHAPMDSSPDSDRYSLARRHL